LGEGATGLYTVVLNGLVGLLGRHASPWAASCRLISCRVGPALRTENEAQPSPTSCSCRPGPENIVLGSCSCRDKKSCYELAHGPRAKWPSIGVMLYFLSIFLCSLIGAHFSMLLEHILFFNDPSLLLQDYKKRNLFRTLEYLFLVDGWHVLRNSQYMS
jgi:hypothetical protein